MPRIVQEGSGAALVKNPALVHDLLAAMVAETSLPVTLKTRPGPRPDRVMMLELLDAAESAGAKGFIMHARFTSQSHSGEAHLDLLAELVGKAHIPVTGNGGVKDAETALAMAETGVASVMVGRAALANPGIFRILKGEESGDLPSAGSQIAAEHVAALVALHAQIAERFPQGHLPSLDDWIALTARTQIFRYFAGMPGARERRRRFATVRTLQEVNEIISS